MCVSYYGSGVPGMLDRARRRRRCPTLFHFGADDAYIPTEGVEALAEAIAGRPGFVLNVEAAGHAFDNHEAEMFYDEAAADGRLGQDDGLPRRAPPGLTRSGADAAGVAPAAARRTRRASTRTGATSVEEAGGAGAAGGGGVRPRCS